MVRWRQKKIEADQDSSKYLQDLMNRIPEDINRLADYIADQYSSIKITIPLIEEALKNYFPDFKGIFEVMTRSRSASEMKLLVAVAKSNGLVSHPTGKDFLKTLDLSKQGVSTMLKRLENDGIMRRHEGGYQIAEPLFYYFLKERFVS